MGVTYVLAYTYGCDDGRIWRARCAVIVAVLDGRWSPRRANRTPPSSADLEAIRKRLRSIAASSCSIPAVMKHRATTRSESVQHKMYMTNLDHSRTGFYSVLIVLTVSSTPAMPGVRPLNHPAFLQGRKAFRASWPCLHFDVPAGTMLSHPGVQSVIVILLIRKNRDETRKMVGVDVPEQERGRHPIIKPSTGNKHGQQQAQRIDQETALAPVDLLATIVPPIGAAHLGGLDRLTINARGTGRGLASCSHTSALAQGLDQLGPCPI